MASPSFGMHARIVAQPGKGDELAAILHEAAAALEANPDCRLFVVSRSLDDEDTDRAAHAASLEEERAQATIARGRPLIAGFADQAEFRPEGGKGV